MGDKNTKKKRLPKRTKKKPKNTKRKTKRKIEKKITPKYINKILTNIHIILSLPSIEFLPSSDIYNNDNEGHYLLMCDFQELSTIINKNTHYKLSPTIQKIFNYNSYDIEDEDEIVFNYNNIRCDNLIIKEQKNDNVKLLFLYLLECNVYNRFKEIIQFGGDYDINELIDYNVDQKNNHEKNEEKEEDLEKVRKMEEFKFNEKLRLEREYMERQNQKAMEKNNQTNEDIQKSIQEINKQNEEPILKDLPLHQENVDQENVDQENVDQGIDMNVEDKKEDLDELINKKEDLEERREEILNEKEKKIEEEYEKKEEKEDEIQHELYLDEQKRINQQNKLEKQIQMKIKGFEQYLENKKVHNISKNSFVVYNVNWFNVCCGLETYDDLYEREVNQKILELGLIINKDEIKDLLLTLFEDKDEYKYFRNIIRNRLITCCEIEPPNFFERLNPFINSFGIFKDCDKKSPQSILYLYDEYRKFIEKKMTISRLDRVLILIYCEIRQNILSKYISLEIIRRGNEKKKRQKIINILDMIMLGDKKIIEHNRQLLEKKEKNEYENYKRKKLNEIKKQIDVKTTLYNDKIIVQKNKLSNLLDQQEIHKNRPKIDKDVEKEPSFMDRLFKIFNKNKTSVDFELSLTPNEKKAYQKAMKKMKGGAEGKQLLQYGITKSVKNKKCNKMKEEKNIYLDHLNLIEECFD